MPTLDVAVLGAGPAGTVAARAMAQAGLRVLLVDAGQYRPRHGIESFPASGAPLAEGIGLLETICAASYGPAASIQMHWRATPETRDFEDAGPLLLDRAALHTAVLQEAVSAGPSLTQLTARVRRILPDAQAVRIETTAGTISAPMVLDARGRRGGGNLVALPFRAQSVATGVPRMRLLAAPGGWFWVAELANGRVDGACFLPAAAVAGSTQKARQAILTQAIAQTTGLNDLLVEQVGRPIAAGMSARKTVMPHPRVLRIGDAALARDPIASHGLVHALRSGVQGAVIAQTLLDPACDSAAARAFATHKHAQSCHGAKIATDSAYGDQAFYSTGFWAQEKPASPPVAPPRPQGVLRLTTPLTRAPVLGDTRIRWAPALELPRSDDLMAHFGPISALDIAAACRPPAPLETISARLEQIHDGKIVRQALAHLMQQGAFAGVDQAATPA